MKKTYYRYDLDNLGYIPVRQFEDVYFKVTSTHSGVVFDLLMAEGKSKDEEADIKNWMDDAVRYSTNSVQETLERIIERD